MLHSFTECHKSSTNLLYSNKMWMFNENKKLGTEWLFFKRVLRWENMHYHSEFQFHLAFPFVPKNLCPNSWWRMKVCQCHFLNGHEYFIVHQNEKNIYSGRNFIYFSIVIFENVLTQVQYRWRICSSDLLYTQDVSS